MQALGLSLLFVTLAMATFWFVAFFIPGQRQAAMDSWRRDLDVRAEIRTEALKRYFIDGLADAETLAAYPTALQVLAVRSAGAGRPIAGAGVPAADLEELFGNFVRIHGVLGVVLWDAEGKTCVKSRDLVLDAACLAPASEVLGSGAPATGFHLHADLGPILTFSAPVRQASGDVRGAVVVAVDPREWLYPLLAQPLSGTSTSEAFLVGRDGADILFLSPLHNRPSAPLSFRRPFTESGLAARAALEGSEILGPYVDYRGVRVLAGGRRIPPSPWALVVKIDENEALAAFRKDMLQKGVFSGALLLALFAGAVAFWRALMARSEVELARSEAKSLAVMHDVLDCSSAPIFIFDLEERILFCNRKFESLNGITRENIVGQRREIFMPGLLAEQHRKSDLEV
ncbi:MAG: PAS domain S-box protein, partial [Thermoanaerobaculia bacterium]